MVWLSYVYFLNSRYNQKSKIYIANQAPKKGKEQAAIEGREQIPELQGDTEKVLVQW